MSPPPPTDASRSAVSGSSEPFVLRFAERSPAAEPPLRPTMTIDGAEAAAHATVDVINPATEDVIGYAPECTREQLDLAVAAAERVRTSVLAAGFPQVGDDRRVTVTAGVATSRTDESIEALLARVGELEPEPARTLSERVLLWVERDDPAFLGEIPADGDPVARLTHAFLGVPPRT